MTLTMAFAAATGSGTASAAFDDMDGPDQDVPLPEPPARSRPTQRQRQRQRQATPPAAPVGRRWSGSLALLFGRCLSPSPDVAVGDEAPCLAGVDATDAEKTGGIAVGANASAGYTVNRHLTLSADLVYEPLPHLVLVSFGSSYELILPRHFSLTHSAGVDAPFGAKGHPPGDPVTVTYSEALRLALSRWDLDASAFAAMSLGDTRPVTSNGARVVLPSPAGLAPARPAPAAIGVVGRQVGADLGAQLDVSPRWALASNLVLLDSLETSVDPVLIDATLLAATLRLGHWSDTLELTGGTYPGSGQVSIGVEFTVRVDF